MLISYQCEVQYENSKILFKITVVNAFLLLLGVKLSRMR